MMENCHTIATTAAIDLHQGDNGTMNIEEKHIMRLDEASDLLKKMYEGAPKGGMATAIHLFGVKYADEIRDLPIKQILIGAGMKKSYATEISKGMNLAKYVRITNEVSRVFGV